MSRQVVLEHHGANSDTLDTRDTTTRFVITAATLVFVVVLIRTAWVSDDAYITFRTIDNFLNGYGLRWNAIERVQAFVHPLWTLVMTAAIAVTGEPYFTSMCVSAALTLSTVVLIATRIAKSLPAAIVAVSALLVSKSVVEYSTSGLENALTHLLLASFFVLSASRERGGAQIRNLSLVASLLVLNRLDLGLLVLPALAVAVHDERANGRWRSIAVGVAPFIAWELFSVIYYGFPFANAAYAKLAPGIPRGELFFQGALYLLDNFSSDPVTPLTILASIAAAVLTRTNLSAAAGIVLYVAFVMWVGGDAMSGRLMTAPFVCAVIQLLRFPFNEFNLRWAAVMGIVWTAGLASERPALFTNAEYGTHVRTHRPSQVVDERRHSYAQTGLLTAHRGVVLPHHTRLFAGYEAWRRRERVHVTDAAGFVGYGAGPHVYVLDHGGLGDPLLARLRAERSWETGRFTRRVPAGYVETLRTGQNQIHDPAIADLHDKLRIVTRDPIWSARRFATILELNLRGASGAS